MFSSEQMMQNEQKETKLFNVIMCYMNRCSLLIRSNTAKRFHSLMTCVIRDKKEANAAKDSECDDRRQSLKTGFVDVVHELNNQLISQNRRNCKKEHEAR